MHSITIDSHAALAFAELLPVQLFEATGGGTTGVAIPHEEATELVHAGKGRQVYANVTAENIGAILDKVASHQHAYDQLEGSTEEIAHRVSSERAQFIRTTAIELLSSWTQASHAVEEPMIKRAIEAAAKVDEALWQFLDVSEEG